MTYVEFFSNLGFDFNIDLKSKVIDIEKEATLSQKLKNSVFFYKSPNNTNTSFYLITSSLETTELEQFRKYVWNKNDADIIFYYPNETDEVVMLYAKYSPIVSNNDSILEFFSTTQKDLDTIEKIRHWQFDSGVFWLNYYSFVDKAKYKGVDKELVATLQALKEQLSKLLIRLISNDNKRNEVVQALIDRTLYIKYLEDKHIINSYFFNHYFKDGTLNYEKLLENNSNADINKLFKIIHEIFNNSLFDQPTIDDKYLTSEVRTLIANSFNHNVNTGQLRLFDFRFDILPVEFISYIYEVFLSEKQKENGIYYTPKKLAQLIVDDVIKEDKIGSILDPSSGSGMFLITGYQRLLEIAQKQGLEPENNIDKIRFRTKLLSDNIFGIEKEPTAQRFTLFSLSLQIFIGINPSDIKEFISKELEDNKKINLFSEFSFFQNIKHANTLNTLDRPFANRKFSYIIGNPPFFEIPNTEEFQNEISFLNSYQVAISDNTKKVAKNIVGKSQISQCFFLKIKDWSNKNTRFGFVSNSSNFYNDYSEIFQEYFYSHYGIEKIYELSRVKKILFEKAKESVVAIIFTNNLEDNVIDYYPVDLGLFSEKPFELLIIQEDKIVDIKQTELIKTEVRLRDFLIGNEYDRNLLLGLKNRSNSFDDILDDSQSNYRGLERIENQRLSKYLAIDIQLFNKLSTKQKNVFHLQFANERYLVKEYIENRSIPYLYSAKKLHPFCIDQDLFIIQQEITKNNFRRLGAEEYFSKKKILLNRFGDRINAAYAEYPIAYSTYLYCLILKDDNYYYFITALLNSDLCNYYVHLFDRKRVDGNYSNIDLLAIRNIPLPKELDKELISNISDISKGLSEGQYEYIEKERELNELIYDLFELSYWERQRVKDYFLPKAKIGKMKKALDSYKNTLKEIVGFYIESPVSMEETSIDFHLIVVKISFGNSSNTPQVAKTKKYLLNEIFEQNPNANFFASQEKIFGKDCVYIIKEDINKNWTDTKAYEDGQDILKYLIPNENGERIH
jgi:hypothetical protein